MPFLDVDGLETVKGNAVLSDCRKPGEPKSHPADAVIIAPATYNTINKLATDVSDTYALGIAAEAIGLGLNVFILPFVNFALANREAFRQSVDALRSEGIQVLLGPGPMGTTRTSYRGRSAGDPPLETCVEHS